MLLKRKILGASIVAPVAFAATAASWPALGDAPPKELRDALIDSDQSSGPPPAFYAEVDHHFIDGDAEIFITGAVYVEPTKPRGERVTVDDLDVLLTAEVNDANRLLAMPFNAFDLTRAVGLDLPDEDLTDVRTQGDGVYVFRAADEDEGAEPVAPGVSTLTVKDGCVTDIWTWDGPNARLGLVALSASRTYVCAAKTAPPRLESAFFTMETKDDAGRRRSSWEVRVLEILNDGIAARVAAD